MVARGSSVILSGISCPAVPSCPYTLTSHFNIWTALCQYSPVIGGNNSQWSDYKAQITNLPSIALSSLLRMIVNKKDLGNSKAQLQLLLSPSVLCGLTGGQLSSLANKSIAVRRVEACIQEVRRRGEEARRTGGEVVSM